MNPSSLTLLLESITNLGNRIFAIENELITYMETNPKGDSQWTEARLRKLEEEALKIPVDYSGSIENIYAELAALKKEFENFKIPKAYVSKDSLAGQWIGELEKRIETLEKRQDPNHYITLTEAMNKEAAKELEKVIDKHHNGT